MLSFQNKHISLAIYGPRCKGLMSHLQVRMNKVEMLYFHSKLPDAARGQVLTRNTLEMFSCLCGPTK